MQLVWTDQVSRKENKPVLILTPLAVSEQTIREGVKFGIECVRSRDGSYPSTAKIVVTNYEQLHHMDQDKFIGVVCDESSCLKNFEGVRSRAITDFLRKMKYRLLCTATASPNDYIELGTHSEALGELGYMDMLGRFFKNDQNTMKGWIRPFAGHGSINAFHEKNKWRFKRHAEMPFWRWVCSWARACRKPSDLGFDDGKFILPPLEIVQTVVKNTTPLNGAFFRKPAISLEEQRKERRETIKERCELVAKLVSHKNPAVVWCHLNPEGDLLEKIIPDAKQVSGRTSDDEKEELFNAFSTGQLRVLVTKPKIGAWGLNWQHCSHMTSFASHSFEQWYQSIRRCWRFGQQNPVRVDMIASEGEARVKSNLERKSEAADKMWEMLVSCMNEAMHVDRSEYGTNKEKMPKWLSGIK